MREDFDYLSGQVQHRGGRGKIREKTVQSYLERWLPKSISVLGAGEVFDSNEKTSRECDILLVDPNVLVLTDSDDFHLVPVEFLYGIFQIKSDLKRNELREDYEVIRTAKALSKLAYIPQNSDLKHSSSVYGRDWHFFPSWGCVFSYQSMRLESLRDELTALDQDTPVEHRADMIVVLGKGVIVNADNEGLLSPWADEHRFRVAVETDNPLTLMTLFTQEVMSNAWMPHFAMRRYLDHVNFGTILP